MQQIVLLMQRSIFDMGMASNVPKSAKTLLRFNLPNVLNSLVSWSPKSSFLIIFIKLCRSLGARTSTLGRDDFGKFWKINSAQPDSSVCVTLTKGFGYLWEHVGCPHTPPHTQVGCEKSYSGSKRACFHCFWNFETQILH